MSNHCAHTSWRLPAIGLAAAGITIILLRIPPVQSAPFAPSAPPEEVQITVTTAVTQSTITRSGPKVAALYDELQASPHDPRIPYTCVVGAGSVEITFLSDGKPVFAGAIDPACWKIEGEGSQYNVSQNFAETLASISGIWLPDLNKR